MNIVFKNLTYLYILKKLFKKVNFIHVLTLNENQYELNILEPK